ncbi:hypothetical protein WR25_24481 [Diploscapter pachys]|uniref:Uncharacterized protein n=1 Tax=Diploscapter pachys TaxID=2018661 RepID=A0A2A2M6J1_9BILA|nr:hypothetical protein WR25_24481 [Diploscapter pachys]
MAAARSGSARCCAASATNGSSSARSVRSSRTASRISISAPPTPVARWSAASSAWKPTVSSWYWCIPMATTWRFSSRRGCTKPSPRSSAKARSSATDSPARLPREA